MDVWWNRRNPVLDKPRVLRIISDLSGESRFSIKILRVKPGTR